MGILWVVAIMCLILYVVVILWFQYWMGIVGDIQFALISEQNRDFRSQQFWRFIFISVLVFFLASCCEIVVSIFDPHYPVYLFPLSILRVVLVNLLAGLSFGLFLWMYAVIGVPSGAFWPLSEDEKQAGKKLFWRRMRYAHLSPDEKAYLKRISSLRAFVISLVSGYLILFLALVVFLLFCGLSTTAMETGFPPASTAEPHMSHAGPAHGGVEILEALFLIATAYGFLPWLFYRIQAWRFLGRD